MIRFVLVANELMLNAWCVCARHLAEKGEKLIQNFRRKWIPVRWSYRPTLPAATGNYRLNSKESQITSRIPSNSDGSMPFSVLTVKRPATLKVCPPYLNISLHSQHAFKKFNSFKILI